MAGVDTVIRIIGAVLALVVIAFVTAVGFTLAEPIYQNLGGPPSSLGWPDADTTVMQFMGLGFAGLALVVVIWLKVAPVRDDVRQEQRPPRF